MRKGEDSNKNSDAGAGRQDLRAVCLGGCHLDRKALADAALVAGVSNPASVMAGFGGVARNVAENLCRLGVAVELVSRLGDDADGRGVLALLRSLPLGIENVTQSPAMPTAFHLIALQPDGEMLVGLADMRIYDEITAALLRGLPKDLWQADAVFADCNLPAESLSFIAEAVDSSCALAINGVSPAKATRAAQVIAAADFLFVNEAEAAALTGAGTGKGVGRPEPEALAAALLAKGVGEVVLTLGAEGLLLADDRRCLRLNSLPGPLRDVTGAGDALAAAYLESRLQGLDMEAAGRRALAAARLTLDCAETVNPALSPARLEQMTS